MEQNINAKFDEKIKELEEKLPKMTVGGNCAELTLTSILDVLGINDGIINNLMIYRKEVPMFMKCWLFLIIGGVFIVFLLFSFNFGLLQI